MAPTVSIEYLWVVVERELRALDVHPTNLNQLQDAICILLVGKAVSLRYVRVGKKMYL